MELKDFKQKPDSVGLLGPYPTPNSNVHTKPMMNGFEVGVHRVGTGVFHSSFNSSQHSSTSRMNLSGFNSSQHSNTSRMNLWGFNSVQHSNNSKVKLPGFSLVQRSNNSKMNLSGFSSVQRSNTSKRHKFPTMGPPQLPVQSKGTGVFLPRVIIKGVDITKEPTAKKTDKQQKKSIGQNKVAAKQKTPPSLAGKKADQQQKKSIGQNKVAAKQPVIEDESLILEFNLPQEWTY